MARKKYTQVEQELMQEIANNLRSILKRKGIFQKELSEMTGLATSTLSDYMNAKTLISPGNLQIIADALGVMKSDIDTSMNEVSEAKSEVISLPVVGRISCGKGSIAGEDIEYYHETPCSWLNGGEYFYLRAKGDSMTGARIFEGDLLLIRKQEDVEDGEIAAVLIDEEAVLKRVYKRNGTLILQSENPIYPPIICSPDDVNKITILGKLKKLIVDF
ncbi:hypothetical protein J6TS7_56330 [Paenibacillus dendritiformis]|uniref:LexA family protein n=1 Tax=Paenibacillus TaxID=44249 RepID=UPI001B0A9665|nr:S24 family peptidase [Paenibacillus dendritiformis]GIO82023.1 hypothetical protein J6TS7_56330 [Paenibacillus dendritiformis]